MTSERITVDLVNLGDDGVRSSAYFVLAFHNANDNCKNFRLQIVWTHYGWDWSQYNIIKKEEASLQKHLIEYYCNTEV